MYKCLLGITIANINVKLYYIANYCDPVGF